MPRPSPGDVWRYDYLWSRQHGFGETEGRKARPVAMVAMLTGRDGRTALFILPITSAPPQPDRLGIEIPQMERRRASLDDMPLWVMIDEYNHDVLEMSYYLDPAARIGSFSTAFHKKVLTAFVTAARERKSRRVPRRDEDPR